tara:strand:- start:90 stop:1160 length:1071 start_codon:yes stop_codon:yes gene_type:complete
MKLYFPKSHYDKRFRGALFPLLKAFIKPDSFTDEERQRIYYLSKSDFEFVANIQDSEIVILPMAWYYYRTTNQMLKAKKLVDYAQACHKEIWSFNAGDYGVKIPSYFKGKVFRMSGYVTQYRSGHRGIPAFIGDYYKKNQQAFKPSEYSKKPKVGFCGQTNHSNLNALKEMGKVGLRNLASYLCLSNDEPQEVMSSSYLRSTALQYLENHPKIETNFICRQQYRAGAHTAEARAKTTQEFYDNIQESMYVVCARGAGNFSVRFYETLMMGRIPVYIHTKDLLPLVENIDWKSHVVWVEANEFANIGEKLLNFHEKLTPNKLRDLQQANRELWQKQLTIGGFFKNTLEQFNNRVDEK